jgi:arginase family enzyme
LHLRLLDLDGSVTAQPTLAEAAAWASVETIALRDLGPALRLWARASTMRRAAARLVQPPGSITLLGSGDFHHLAVPLVAQAREPVTLVHFDNHPDWVRWAPRWHCGSWVNRALELGQVERVVTIGPCSSDLERPQFKGGNLAALAGGRIALFPWRHAPSRVWGRIADGAGHRRVDGRLVWRNLAECDARRRIDLLLEAIATAAIWITIDKDVLAESEALTNWDQGEMPLHALLELIAGLGAQRRIVGADICGEWSEPALHNPFKRIESRLDRPLRATDARGLARNEAVNRALLRAISEAAAC